MSKKPKEEVASGFATQVEQAVLSHRLAEYPQLAEQLFSDLGLDYYYKQFMETAFPFRSEGKQVYHGIAHSLQVALNCYEGALHQHFTTREKKMALVAGLYHDANHTQGEQCDASNIHFALASLRSANDHCPEHQRFKPEELQVMVEAIRLTEYPYKVKDTKHPLGRLLRDADAMTLYTEDPDLLLDLFQGLINEINTPLGWRTNQGATMEEFCQRQSEFVTRQQWNTQWAKMKAFKRNWPQAGRRLIHMLQVSARRGWIPK